MIANYSDLQNSVQGWLNRQDLAQVVTAFIGLAESDLNRTLRARDMISPEPVTLSFVDSIAALPDDFIELRGAPTLASNGVGLKYRTPEQLSRDLADPCITGDPVFYTLIGLSMRIAAAPDPLAVIPTDIDIFYYQRIPALTEPTDSNWLLAKHPDLYLYSALIQSAPYLKDDDRLSVWGGIREKIIADIAMDTERGSFRGAALSVRPAGGSIG